MNNTEKKILIISHNPLSQVNNNGKTLVSIFEGIPEDNIYQIYLNSDIPDHCGNFHYLQINEKQILRSIVKRKNLCCQEIKPNSENISVATIKVNSFGIHVKRLLREYIWKTNLWKARLGEWLSDKQIDVVFFMAGDGLFAYDVYSFVLEHLSCKGCLFFTDDYILGKSSYSPVAAYRQFLLKQKIRKTLAITKELYVISDEMKKAYFELFDIEGYVVRNFSVERKLESITEKTKDTPGCIDIIYAGGLHYDRWKVLAEISNVLRRINDSGKVKCHLKIYSAQRISDKIIGTLTLEGVSEFCGKASAKEIADLYANADVLLHVESFEKKAIASTKYSFSTKIPEYLSAGKCILAVGPSEVASIKYLAEFACVISDSAELFNVLTRFMNDDEYRKVVKAKCEERYEVDFAKHKQMECLDHILYVS